MQSNATTGTPENQSLVKSIMDAMQAEIRKYGLYLMRTYPNDLLVHDKRSLEEMAFPGAKIAWMCGNTHTHIVFLGINQDENESVKYLTNFSSSDRFYFITVQYGGNFKMEEVSREGFAALSRTAVQYERQGDASNFWLVRQKSKVGHIAVESIGTFQEPKMRVTITPVEGISGLDRAALLLWCSKAATAKAGSLFTPCEIVWEEPYTLQQAA